MWPHLGVFAWNLWGHLSTLLAGCLLSFVVGIIQKHILKRPISATAEVAIFFGFIFFACFQAWQDAYTSMKGYEAALGTVKAQLQQDDKQIRALNERAARVSLLLTRYPLRAQ